MYELGLLGIVRPASLVRLSHPSEHVTGEDHPCRGFPMSVQGIRTCACRYGQGHLRSKREPADGGAKVEAGN